MQDMFFKVDETDYELTSEESSAYSFCEKKTRLVPLCRLLELHVNMNSSGKEVIEYTS